MTTLLPASGVLALDLVRASTPGSIVLNQLVILLCIFALRVAGGLNLACAPVMALAFGALAFPLASALECCWIPPPASGLPTEVFCIAEAPES